MQLSMNLSILATIMFIAMIGLHNSRILVTSLVASPLRNAAFKHSIRASLSTASDATPSSSHVDPSSDSYFMKLAIRHAQFAYREGEVPIGAVVVDQHGKVLAASRNRVESSKDASSHAELDVLKKAAAVVGNWRLSGCTLYSTLEPCHMCLGDL